MLAVGAVHSSPALPAATEYTRRAFELQRCMGHTYYGQQFNRRGGSGAGNQGTSAACLATVSALLPRGCKHMWVEWALHPAPMGHKHALPKHTKLTTADTSSCQSTASSKQPPSRPLPWAAGCARRKVKGHRGGARKAAVLERAMVTAEAVSSGHRNLTPSSSGVAPRNSLRAFSEVLRGSWILLN